MQENALDLAIKEYGQSLGIDNFELGIHGITTFELESGEAFNLEVSNDHLLFYLSVEVLPYIVSRVLENLFIMANPHTHGGSNFLVGLHKSTIVICIQIPLDSVSYLQLQETAEKLWDLRTSALH